MPDPTSMATPVVSVVMPVRDGERFLRAAIDSVLAQTLADFELIIIDDGSNDSTPAILAEAARRDPRIVVVTKGRVGIVAALNVGLAMARAPLVARFDADDIALPERLALQVEAMQREPARGLLGGFAETIDENGLSLGIRKPPVSHEALLAALGRDSPFIHSTIMFRTDTVRALGGYRAALEAAEDYDLWLRMAERTRIANLPATLVRYRVHRQSQTGRKEVRIAFSARLARRAAAERQAGRSDPIDGLTIPPDWNRTPADSFLAADARDFCLLQHADPVAAKSLDPAAIDPAVFDGLTARLDYRERRLAQHALIHLLRRNDRPPWLGRLRLFGLLVSLHPARAAKMLAQAATGIRART